MKISKALLILFFYGIGKLISYIIRPFLRFYYRVIKRDYQEEIEKYKKEHFNDIEKLVENYKKNK